MTHAKKDPTTIWTQIRRQLEEQGVDLDALAASCGSGVEGPVKVVCIGASLSNSLDELGNAARDQVLMVRVDTETIKSLDSWVETEAVRSRSEAAALFLREGLRLRTEELAELADALEGVDAAKKRLREKANRVLGTDPPEH